MYSFCEPLECRRHLSAGWSGTSDAAAHAAMAPAQPVLARRQSGLEGIWEGKLRFVGVDPDPLFLRITKHVGQDLRGFIGVAEGSVDMVIRGTIDVRGNLAVRLSHSANGAHIRGTATGRLTTDGLLEGRLSISQYGSDHSGTYRLRRRRSDADDTLSEATMLGQVPDKRVVEGRIERDTDVDLFAFRGKGGQNIGIDLVGLDDLKGHAFVRLMDAAGRAITGNGPFPVDPGGRYELRFHVQESGTYFLGVSNLWNSSYDPRDGDSDVHGTRTGPYKLVMIPDTHDPDDQIAQARPLGPVAVPRALRGTLVGYDVDVYSFEVTTGQRLRFDPEATGAVRLFRGDGTELAVREPNDLGGAFDHAFDEGGTFFMGVGDDYGNFSYDPISGFGDEGLFHVRPWAYRVTITAV